MGMCFLGAGVVNVMSVPHLAWFPFVDYRGYVVVAWLRGRWLVKAPAGTPDSNASGAGSHDAIA